MYRIHKINIPEVKERKVTINILSATFISSIFKIKYEELKVSVFYLLLDDLISGINSIYKQDIICLINSVPNILNFNITIEVAVILYKFAKISPDTLIAETKLLKNSTDKHTPRGTTNTTVDIVKSKLRSTMSQDRLESLILLFME